MEIRDLAYVYEDGTRALNGINLSIDEREFIGLLASNGGGKTTLLKAVVGLLKAHPPSILIDNKPLSKLKRIDLARAIGLVFQNPNDQLFASTVEEDVSFGPRNLGLADTEVEERVEIALGMVDMLAHRRKPIHHLSFGQQKRVCIAGVLAMRPRILLLDEPTAGLDPKSEANLLHILGRLNKESGVTIVMATHMVDLIPLFVDRIFVLKEGRITIEGTPETVFSSTQVMEEVDLRLPYITHLIEELKHKDQLPFDKLPLTLKDARSKLVSLMPDNIFSGSELE
ncbi:MAG TPA: energy-coupling factor ABC transporter ATP-binding protein [Actinobacteria bacterium]|nr:energy-coupling factor ABC transporter ATP-binding protein [Actinomycetota bacterium]